MKRRLVLLTEIIAPYRTPVFNALSEREDVDLHVIFLSETDRSLRDWEVVKSEIRFSYEVLPSFRRRVGKYNVLLNWGLNRALRQAKPDAIVCGGYSYLASWQAARWARLHRVPFLMWVESNAYDQRREHAVVEYLKRRILHDCVGFIVPGRRSREYLESMGLDSRKIFCAPNAVDNHFFCRSAESARNNILDHRKAHRLPAHYFLFSGRLVSAKGVFDLLEAYARLSPELRAQFGVVFVGSGPAEHDLRRRAEAISPGTVCFPGFVQREQLAVFYALADILVFPTHTDTWGLVVNEAMACGLPIICSSVAGCAADLVEDGVNGRIVPSREVGQLASAMERLATDSVLRDRMGSCSREKIKPYSAAGWSEGVSAALHAIILVYD